MVRRRYTVRRSYDMRSHETWNVETDRDLEKMQEEMSLSDFDEWLMENGTEQYTDTTGTDDDDLSHFIDDYEEVPERQPVLPVPLPPTTAAQAEAWVRWAETEIGLGWHPDTSGSELVTNGPIGCEARCACGETFSPNDVDDTVHGEREDGEPCGLHGVIVGVWGTPVALFPDKDVRARYDAGLAAAHELLPDIYATSMEILKELHPDLLATTKGV